MAGIDNPYTELARHSADLCAFVLVCQSGKLSAAAEQMRISQPSMSLRIKNLETSLNSALFVRHSAGMALTSHGERLYALLQEPLAQAAAQLQSFQHHSAPERVVISVDHAFASFWLLPRLPQLREQLGDTDICIHSSQDPLANAGQEADISIFMAKPERAHCDARLLFQETVAAVCSAKFKADNPALNAPSDLLKNESPLLHLRNPDKHTPWMDWSQWLSKLECKPDALTVKTEFNSYEMIIKAACVGQGVALGWHKLIDELINKGELVALFPDRVQTDTGYYIQTDSTRVNDKVLTIRDWIVTTAR